MKSQITCDWCGKPISRSPSQIKRHNFCCRSCLASFSSKSKNPEGYSGLKDFTNISKHMTKLNLEMNPDRMSASTREKLRMTKLDSGKGVSYRKLYGRHEHRVAAEKMLGRHLTQEEVVHHVDGDKRNNTPDNLMVLPSQSAHAALHKKLHDFFMMGGDAQ
ncbi:MAG: HNH endonuclease [Anaerotruncus rubiinfantis]|jgi:hypothetical protein